MAENENPCQPRPLDEAWKGFTAIRDPASQKISKAQCNACQRIFKKRNHKFLNKHRSTCTKGSHNNSAAEKHDGTDDSDSESVDLQYVGPNTQSTHSREAVPNTQSVISGDKIQNRMSTSRSSPLGGQACVVPRKINQDEINQSMKSLEVVRTLQAVSSSDGVNNKKRRSEESQIQQTTEQLNRLFLNPLIRLDINFHDAKSLHLRKFVQSLNHAYNISSGHELESEILPVALNMFKTNCTGTKVMEILIVESVMLTMDESTEYFLVSLVLDQDNNQIYVNSQKVITFTKENVENFCWNSVDMVFTKYEVYVSYIIHDMDFDIEPSEVESVDLFVGFFRSFKHLIRELKSDKIKFTTTISTADVPHQYIANVNELESSITRCRSASHAVKLVQEFASSQNHENSEKNRQIINDFIEPIHLVPMFFNYKLHTKYMSQAQELVVLELVNKLSKRKCTLDPLSDFMGKLGKFQELFNPLNKYSNEQFWDIAGHYYKAFSTFARCAYNILAMPMANNLVEIVEFYKRNEVMSVDYRNLSISLALGDVV